MANRAGDLGREGEQGVINHLNKWIDNPKLFGIERARSKGVNDVGDLTNVPLTTIECKNYGQISLTSLINNARGKALESEKPVWWLTIKKRGRSGAKNGGWWYAATDLLGLIEGLQLEITDDEIDFLMDRSEYNYIIKPIGDFSGQYGNRFTAPEYRWSVMIIGDTRTVNALDGIYDALEWFEEDYDEICEEENVDLIIPVVIVRGKDASEDDLEAWYALTTVHHMARILESLGLLPQNTNEYDPDHEMYWRNYKLTRFPEYEVDLLEAATPSKEVVSINI